MDTTILVLKGVDFTADNTTPETFAEDWQLISDLPLPMQYRYAKRLRPECEVFAQWILNEVLGGSDE